MTEKMDCQTIQEWLPAYVLDALEIDEELAVLEHLRTCETCRAEADVLRPVANSLGLAASDAGQPSPHTKLQVMARIATVPDPRKGERLILVTTKKDPVRSDLIMFARSRGASEMMVPAEVLIVEKVPLLGSGKIDYPALQSLVNERVKLESAPVAV